MIFEDLFKILDDPFHTNLKTKKKKFAVFRHHFKDVITILREDSPFDDAMIDEHQLLSVHGPIDGASKLVAIRTDITLSEMACASREITSFTIVRFASATPVCPTRKLNLLERSQ